jgi:iron complex outermembrane receptor protein
MPESIAQFDRRTLAVAILAASVALPVASQDRILEEVIVTAQKRESSLQDTSIAITAFSSATFDELNIVDSSDYEAIVPSLSVRESPSRLFIRGVGRVTNSLGTEPGIALYLDQIYTSEITVLGRANSLTTQRVEVLRGPQGTLFGRNATGGAVSVSSLRPTDEFEHHARLTVGDYDQLDWGVSSSGPVTDTLGYRVYAYGNERDGYIDNLGGDDIWDQDQDGFGAQLSWNITDDLDLWFSYARDESDNKTSGVNFGGYLISPYRPDLVTQDGFLVSESYQWDQENPAVNDPYKVDMNDVLRAKNDDNNKFIAHLTWNLENVTLKYIGGYFEGNYSAVGGDLGFTSNPDNRVVEGAEQDTEVYSHEIQLLSAGDGPLQWVGGLYYYHAENEQPYSINSLLADYLELTVPLDDLFDPAAAIPNLGDNLQYLQETELETDSYAVYVDANYSFNEAWKLTVGMRYSYDEKEGTENQYVVADAFAAAPTLPPAWDALGFPENCCGLLITDPADANRKIDDDWDNVSGRVVLDYMYSNDAMVYASISTGYKAGGFRLGSLQENPSFDEETVLSYEVGYKGTINDTLRINAAAYYYDYEDMQVLVPTLTDENLPVEEVVNADKAEVLGLEIEATWLVTDNLTLMGNYSYIDGEYDDFCCAVDTIGDPDAGEQDLSGNDLTQAPENKIFLNANYYIPTGYGDFVPSISYSWVDERQYDVFDTDVTRADDYYRLDAQLTWTSPSDALRVIASGRNLTEEETWTNLQRLNAEGALNGQINAPRTWSVEVQYDF